MAIITRAASAKALLAPRVTVVPRSLPVSEDAAAAWGLVPATMPQRIVGAAIDALIITVLAGLASAWVASRTLTTVQVRIDAQTGERIVIDPAAVSLNVVAALPALLTAVYVIVGIALVGRTLGGWAVGIRCVRASTGGRPGWSVSVRRWALLFGIAAVGSVIPVIGPWAWVATAIVGASPLLDRSGWWRGWQDRFAGDLVVQARAPRDGQEAAARR